MKLWLAAALLALASAALAQSSLDHKACLFGAGEKLPRIDGMAATGHRFVAPPGDSKAKTPGPNAIAVEIDVMFAGGTATYLFVCVGGAGGERFVFPRGIVR